MIPAHALPAWQRMWLWWAAYMAAGIVWFGIAEGLALAKAQTGDTLSESVWFLRYVNSAWYWFILDIVMVTGLVMVWLIFHFKWQSGRA